MANYTGAQRTYYNVRRQLQSKIAGFQKAKIPVPPAFYNSNVQKILETSPAKASKGLLSEAVKLKNQMAFAPKTYDVRAWQKNRRKILERISAPPEKGGLGYTNVNEQNMDVFFEFMDYVRTKYESMRFDSDIYAAAANEMLGQAKRRGVTAAELGQHFERFAEQAIRITGSNRTLINYQQNFNRLARRLGL